MRSHPTRPRHPAAVLGVALALAGGGTLSGCAKPIKTYAVPPSTYHSAQQFSEIPYAVNSASQRLDLDIPEGSSTEPLVIIVHGGGWRAGDKGLPEVDAAKQLKRAGYAVARVNYRLGTEAVFPAAVQDVKAAVRWLRAHAATYHLDPRRFAIWGAEAGGYLAAAVGVTGDLRTPFDPPDSGDPTVTGVSSAVQAVLVWSAPVDFGKLDAQAKAAGCAIFYQVHGKADSDESRWLGGALASVPDRTARANLTSYLTAGTPPPPFLITVGTADCVNPPGQARELDKALTDHGGHSTLTLVKGAGPPDKKFLKSEVKPGIAFLDRVLP